MTPTPPRSTRHDTIFPYTTLCRSDDGVEQGITGSEKLGVTLALRERAPERADPLAEFPCRVLVDDRDLAIPHIVGMETPEAVDTIGTLLPRHAFAARQEIGRTHV